MVVYFENDKGKILMSGGIKYANSGKNVWKIKEITGIGLPEKSYRFNTFTGIAGRKLAEENVLARTITVSVDIDMTQNENFMPSAIGILALEGRLTLLCGRRKRCIACCCVSFEKSMRKERISSAVIQFEADYPYFNDGEAKSVVLKEKVNRLSSPFTLPCMFSQRQNKAYVNCMGDIPSEPVITIESESDSESDIKIINRTTNSEILLEYKISPKEKIRINIPDREVVSIKNGEEKSILYALSEESHLGDFVLLSGMNLIEIDAKSHMKVVCDFYNNYSEAIY